MPFESKLLNKVAWLGGVSWLMVVLLAIPTAWAQLPRLRVQISDTTAMPGAQNTVISVYMDNYQDTVAGFNIWLMLDRNDIMEFQTDSATKVDTTYWICNTWEGSICVESTLSNPLNYDFIHIDTSDVLIGNFDTTGTLCSGWQYFDARSLGIGFDLNIAGIANMPGGDTLTGIAPQVGGVLCKILADVFDIPDTMQDRTVNILIQHLTLDHFNFSLPDGSSIGILYDTVPDTNCWVCTMWVGPDCMAWERVSIPPPGGCDSIDVDTNLVPYLDTVNVKLYDGSVEVLVGCCNHDGIRGDVNMDDLGPNVSDVTRLVSYVKGIQPTLPCFEEADVAVPYGSVNVSDVTALVSYVKGISPTLPACP
jgi:hypothetical protein